MGLEEKLRNFVTTRVNPIVDAPPNSPAISPQKHPDLGHQVEEKLRNFLTTRVNPILEALDRDDKIAVGGNRKASNHKCQCGRQYNRKPSSDMREALRGRSRERSDSSARR